MDKAPSHVLLIAYYFPPLGLGGVWRALGLYKYLEQYGIKLFVLTVKDILYPEYDHSLLENVDRSRIIRSGSFDPARLMHLAGLRRPLRDTDVGGFTTGPLCRPDYKRGWNSFAYNKAGSIIEENNIRCVITTSPPPSSHMIGLKLKEKYDLPWIADFQDLWYSLPIEKIYGRRNQIAFAQKLKRAITDGADEVVGVNNSILSYIGRGVLIYNAADDAVLDYWRSPERSDDGSFKIGVLGTISRLTPIEPLFEILSGLAKRHPEMKNKIKIIHAGKGRRTEMLATARNYDLDDNLELPGYLEKRKAIEALADCHVLYISVKHFGEYHILPGRIFDMLVSGKPILGVANAKSDLAEILSARPQNLVVDHSRLDDAVEPLYALLASPTISRDNEDIKQYTASFMAEKYAAVIERLI